MTAAAILADANPSTFPTDLLVGAESAIAFYGAGFLGRNDVIHLWNARLPDVAVIDTDEGKLMEMARLYERPTWLWRPVDAVETAREWAASGVKVDIVTVDPWTAGTRESLYRLPLWLSLTKRALVIGVCADWFAGLHLDATLEAFNGWREGTHWNGEPTPPAATRLVKRSDYRGGTYWAVFEVNQ